MTKTCSKCKKEKELDQFSKDSSAKNNIRSQCRLCCSIWNKEYNKNNTHKRRRYKDKRRYGLTSKQSDIVSQLRIEGLCMCCGIGGALNRYNKLYVDHDHNTGAVRGLLCRKCNTAL